MKRALHDVAPERSAINQARRVEEARNERDDSRNTMSTYTRNKSIEIHEARATYSCASSSNVPSVAYFVAFVQRCFDQSNNTTGRITEQDFRLICIPLIEYLAESQDSPIRERKYLDSYVYEIAKGVHYTVRHVYRHRIVIELGSSMKNGSRSGGTNLSFLYQASSDGDPTPRARLNATATLKRHRPRTTMGTKRLAVFRIGFVSFPGWTTGVICHAFSTSPISSWIFFSAFSSPPGYLANHKAAETQEDPRTKSHRTRTLGFVRGKRYIKFYI
ncbi:hypothetical protein V1478_017895 [Vespula squamosa]|uniref:Uncharacterized protein n=1 Tax=Vespula squamosa TaxID=30214 RepID=A0ABD1ZW70_VESSQ